MSENPFANNYDQFPGTVAFVTMIKDDHSYLTQWIMHYAREFPGARFYVLDHASTTPTSDAISQTLPPDIAAAVDLIDLLPFHYDDEARAYHVSQLANILLYSYETVISSDVDEILLASPFADRSLRDIIAALPPGHHCPVGLDIVQSTETEDAFDFTGSLSEQRSFGFLNTSYSKPIIWKRRGQFAVGLHGLDRGYTFTPEVILCHLQNVDLELARQRIAIRRETEFSEKPIETRRGAFWKAPQREDLFEKLREQKNVSELHPAAVDDFMALLQEKYHSNSQGWHGHGVNQRSPFYRIEWQKA